VEQRSPVIAGSFPRVSGTYILLLALPEDSRLAVGRLGTFRFPAGIYAYAGSARGPGGLAGRLRHHLSPVSRPHWHIDALRAAAAVIAVWWCADDVAREHAWAAALRDLPGASLLVPRFGASDCRCPGHLLHYAAQPDRTAFAALAGGEVHAVSWPPAP